MTFKVYEQFAPEDDTKAWSDHRNDYEAECDYKAGRGNEAGCDNKSRMRQMKRDVAMGNRPKNRQAGAER